MSIDDPILLYTYIYNIKEKENEFKFIRIIHNYNFPIITFTHSRTHAYII